MVRRGTSGRPVVVRVRTQARAEEILSICEHRGWKVIVGVESDKEEDLSDLERLLRPAQRPTAKPRVARNAPCPCGSGRKYKNCCAVTGSGSRS